MPGDGAYRHEIPVVKLHLCGAQERTECSDLGAQSMSPTVQSKCELMGCSSMRVLPQKLPMQELARNIKGWSLAFSHVHWARQFKPSWSRQYMPPYIALRMIEVHRVDIKYFN